MNVTSIRYHPVEGGALGGHFALHVTLGASDGPGVILTATELATKIHDCFESLDLKFKAIRGVLIDCRSSAPLAEEMVSLLGTLKDWQLHIVLWVGEHIRFPWFEYAAYITVFVASKNWPNFRVNEIRYVPPDDPLADWEEPEIFEVNQNATAYLVPGSSYKTGDVLRFVTEAKRAWGVVFPARWDPAIDFKLKETT